MQDTTKFVLDLNKAKPSEYAVLMYDAFGKIGSDFTGGNINRPGSARECLLAQAHNFSGQYCQVILKQEQTKYFVGICVPDSCSEAEVQTLVVYEAFHYKNKSLVPPYPSMFLLDSMQGIYMIQCLSENVSPDSSAIICLFMCCLLIAVPLAATIYIAVIKWKHEKEAFPSDASRLHCSPNDYGTLLKDEAHKNEEDHSKVRGNPKAECSDVKEENSKKSYLYNVLQAFSLQKCAAGVWTTESASENYSSLNGIRILSLLWIISGHTIQLSAWNNLDNEKRWKETVENNPLYIFAYSGPVYLAVDTFLLVGGLLSVKSLFSFIQKADDKISMWLVVNYLFKRFKRIQPLHLYTVCLVIGLFSVIPKGSFWFIVESGIENCKRYWWSNVLLINNLFTTADMCTPWTWYLSVDFQFYISTPLLVLLYRRNKYAMIAVASIFLLISCLISALLTAFLQLPVHQPTTLAYETYFQYYYNKPYARYGPYVVGIILGIFMKTKNGHILEHRWQAALGWITTFTVMALLVGMAYILQEVPQYPSVAHAVYQGLHRTVWAAAVAWIILACEEGYGGFINTFLSLNIWIPFSNISFACYMIHPVLIILYNGKQETSIHYTDMNFFYLFMGNLALTVILGYALTVLIEKPYLFLKICKR
ncbi:O-acyltransferase like protein isoform X1 [Lepisosteus oculatus]|uniref:O-acyltransferase like protein isoform X1 n=1 Tax=Lepisosteus oculatus TaxID=7918 RepID=UPI0003EAE0D5|nr:PREDICTED: nose resistant to fluoxetine protein 6-like isoform X1 [Lepisosteus oculatus]